MSTRQATSVGRLSAGMMFGLIVTAGCTGNRFHLANRDDTPYERRLAQNDVRVPVTPTGDGPAIASLGPAPVPVVPQTSNPVRLSTSIPAVPSDATYPSPGPIGYAQPAPVGSTYPSANQRPLLTETPRPGAPGSRLDMSPAGVNLAGRVVDPTGQPIARANVQVLDPRQPDAIVAEVASDDFGMFQVRNIAAGGTYQVSAASQGAGGRLAGTVQTSAPDTALVIQLQPETLGNGLSPLGNRLSPTSRTAPSPVEQLASSATTTATTIGSVTINTIQPVSRSGLGETVPLSRVLPPEPTPRDDEPLAAPAGGAKSFSKEDISWDLPATGADGGSPARSNAEPGAPARSNAEPGAPARSNAEPGAPARSNAGLANATDRDLSLPADLNLDLPSSKDLQLDDFKSIDPAPASRTNLNPPAKNPSLAFAGTGLEYAKVYDLDGNTRPVGALAGDVILLDFFGSWCGPCRRAIPELNDIYDRHTRAGLRVVGVACEYGEAVPAVKSANDAIEKLSIRYPVVVSPMDEPSELREHFGVSAYPTVVLLDRRGKVLFKGQGGDPATLGQLEAAIERALANVKVAAR